ncbi:DUF2304 domain-containing protein [Xylanimonas oleitrophica]|uniref:DUF2304 domain-containing protein n=1 Tax=Xylanimonas oleitrophica TaxID=2607479 RepID=A0A2W5X1Y8_9MICO|nr:DUF2304 domain-containing protein [Xylanimonas oleitrophica]PZR54335.1 DUF2304 domain-containing protein [Xylanimonas oleitrophica]
MLIQILLVIAVVALLVMLARSTADARHQAITRLAIGLFFVAALGTILWPHALTRVAQLVGVGRGTDLLLYGLVILFIAQVARSHRRSNELQRKITVLARQLALSEARHNGGQVAADRQPRDR